MYVPAGSRAKTFLVPGKESLCKFSRTRSNRITPPPRTFCSMHPCCSRFSSPPLSLHQRYVKYFEDVLRRNHGQLPSSRK